MSNLKYKKGDRFIENESTDDLEILEIFEIETIGENGYFMVFENKNTTFINGWIDEAWIDKHFNKIEKPKTDMNIEGNKHHQLWEGTQSIDIMKKALTKDEYIGFLKGQILKYQLRLGKKDDPSKEVKKIEDYRTELDHVLKYG